MGSGLLTFAVDQFFMQTGTVLLVNIDYSPIIRFSLWIGYLNIFGIELYEIYRAKQKPGLYAAMALGNAATLLISVIGLVAIFQFGLMGVLQAMLLTGFVWAVIFSIAMLPYITVAFDFEKLRKALAYSLPLLPHFLSHWILNLSDKLILGANVTLGELGIYSLAYNFGNIQQVLTNSGNSAIMPHYGGAKEDEIKQLPVLFARYLQVMAVLTLVIALFSDVAIKTIAPVQYATAGGIVPWVAMGFFFLALYYGPMNAITLLAGESRYVWLVTMAAGIYNIVANILLTPVYGILAAAENTTIGYAILFVLMYQYSTRVIRVKYDWTTLGR